MQVNDSQLQKCRPRQRSISVQYLRKLFHFFRQGISRDVVPQEEVVTSCLSWLYDEDFVFFGPIEKSLTDFRLDVACGFALIPSKLFVCPRQFDQGAETNVLTYSAVIMKYQIW